ncbi:MAG: uroporphyrinogen-III synthase [Methylobacteriaceae bacterium]|jgi:uroporphyrinogen-III synthase|nr:uroporphyrinogen-III synthase [Methylobacteriaceae bacterium]
MRILLTRARADAERTAARLAALGHTAIIAPVIEIAATGAAIPDAAFDAIIATSAHALRSAPVHSLASTPLYAVGERTREAAERAAWRAPIHVAADAQALIAHLGAASPAISHALYLAGRDRKADLEAAAQAMRLSLQVVEVYVAHDVFMLSDEATRCLQRGELDCLLHYSRRSAELFIRTVLRAELWPQAAKLQHFALSVDVAEALAATGLQAVSAAEPDEDHLFALLDEAER